MLHKPVVPQAAIAHRVRDIGVPQELLHDTRVPRDRPVIPVIH